MQLLMSWGRLSDECYPVTPRYIIRRQTASHTLFFIYIGRHV